MRKIFKQHFKEKSKRKYTKHNMLHMYRNEEEKHRGMGRNFVLVSVTAVTNSHKLGGLKH